MPQDKGISTSRLKDEDDPQEVVEVAECPVEVEDVEGRLLTQTALMMLVEMRSALLLFGGASAISLVSGGFCVYLDFSGQLQPFYVLLCASLFLLVDKASFRVVSLCFGVVDSLGALQGLSLFL